MKKHCVVTLVYDQLCTFEFACAVEIFALKRPEIDANWYDFQVCAIEQGPLHAMGGITITAPYQLSLLKKADTLIIPGWRNIDELPSEEILSAIRVAYRRGARICSICSGVFILAAAGIMEGKNVTTHWRLAEKLATRYPNLRVEPDKLYVDSGQVITSAGSAAGLDMLLYIIRKDHGAKISNQVAQRLVIAPHREGGQAQFIPRPMTLSEQGRLSKLMGYLRKHPAQNHTITSMAKFSSMSPRTLQRQFQDATGTSPIEWLIRERIAQAKELLESSKKSLIQISELTGFGSEESFRRHFKRIVNTSPSAYRHHFSIAA
jgi:AraC family transcriptional regulator, transcriptional activator FtrA